MNKAIVPNIWFNGTAKEAVDFYIEIFPHSEVQSTSYYPKVGLQEFQKHLAGKELTVSFTLNGNPFIAINGGPEFKFTEAVSFTVTCEDQNEIDYYWSKLSSVPDAEQCGWCKDKYGLSWQIVPENMEALMQKPDAFTHMLNMKKLVIAEF